MSAWEDYLDWAVRAFLLSSTGVRDETQIHTHMCYSDFNDIFGAIKALDTDVISIESSKSDLKLLKAFEEQGYDRQIGPGLYDIQYCCSCSLVCVARLLTTCCLVLLVFPRLMR